MSSDSTSDLEIAKKELKENNLNLVIAKYGKIIFSTDEDGVRGLVRAIDNYARDMYGSSVADTVVGKAAAMLCSYAKVSSVYGGLMSINGRNFLIRRGIDSEYEKLVEEILNRERRDICPFERLVKDCNDVREAYGKIKSFLLTQRKPI